MATAAARRLKLKRQKERLTVENETFKSKKRSKKYSLSITFFL